MSDEPAPPLRRAPHEKQVDPLFIEFIEFVPELHSESDRGVTLIATSFIDELLKRILEAFFADAPTAKTLLKVMGPLGSFDARTQTAFVLGLISQDERLDIDRLGRIRNHFAHKVKVSFNDQKPRDLCALLTFGPQLKVGTPGAELLEQKPRDRFDFAAVAIILRLTQRLPKVLAQKRVASDWK